MTTVVNKELNFSHETKAGVPSYKMRPVLPLSEPTIADASTCEATFNLPSSVVYNLNKSYLDFEVKFANLNTKYNNVHLGVIPVEYCRLTTSRGVRLLDRNNLRAYSRAMLPYSKRKDEWMMARTMYANNTSDNGSKVSGFVRATTTAEARQISNAATASAPIRDYFNFPTAWVTGAVGNGTTQGIVYVNFRVPLADMAVHSFFSIDNDLFPNEILTLTIGFPAGNTFGFTADDADLGTPVALATAPSITASSMKLYLAVQDNRAIAEELMKTVLSSGISTIFQDVTEFKQNTTAGTTYSKALQVNGSSGKQLLRAYHCLFIADTNTTLQKNINNVANTKWTNCRLYLNQVPESDYNLTQYELFNQKYDNIYSDSIVPDEKSFAHFPLIIHDFSGVGASTLHRTKVDSGLSLSQTQEVMLELPTKTGADYVHYCWCVCNKTLSMSSEGLRIV